ncbi:MAG: hypothetical protein N2044_01340 [Cyclobacteriaceae bacterium]|nr:hypothetical protein [Cyclobacteriaceae bacterium]
MEIIHQLNDLNFGDLINKINQLSGFFVLLFFDRNHLRIFNDASGQLEVFIYRKGSRFIIASQPHLTFPLLGAENYDVAAPRYVIEHKTTIFNKTPLQDVEKLIPNFYYDVTVSQLVRFFPLTPLIEKTSDEVAPQAAFILEKTMESLVHRKPAAVALTGGWDSRLLFAASLKYSENVKYFIFNHKTPEAKSDVDVARKIVAAFSKHLEVIEYDSSLLNSPSATDTATWKKDKRTQLLSAYLQRNFPGHYIVNGNVSEIARSFYDPLPEKLSSGDICYIIGAGEGVYEKQAVENWRQTVNGHLHILDLIYWEHKMPNWAGAAKSVFNINSLVISPFNNRYLLSLLLSVPRKDRDKYFSVLHAEILKITDKKLIEIPFNPTFKHRIIALLKLTGVYPVYRKIFFRLRKLSFSS